MTTTPTLWRAKQQANTTDGSHRTTIRSARNSLGSPMAPFIMLWESNTDGGPDGNAAGNDIIGQRYNAIGNKIGTDFRVNQGFFADDEGNVVAAALPNGNFVIAMRTSDAAGTAIRYSILTRPARRSGTAP